MATCDSCSPPVVGWAVHNPRMQGKWMKAKLINNFSFNIFVEWLNISKWIIHKQTKSLLQILPTGAYTCGYKIHVFGHIHSIGKT